MTLLSRIKKVAQQKNMSVIDVAIKAGIAENSIYGWSQKTPKADNLAKVADVLHVSVDYLMERTDDPSQYLSETERMTSNIDLKEAKNNGAILSWGGVDIDDDDMEIIKRILEGK